MWKRNREKERVSEGGREVREGGRERERQQKRKRTSDRERERGERNELEKDNDIHHIRVNL